MWLRPRRSGPFQSYLGVIFIRFRGPQALNDRVEEPTLLCNHRNPLVRFWLLLTRKLSLSVSLSVDLPPAPTLR